MWSHFIHLHAISFFKKNSINEQWFIQFGVYTSLSIFIWSFVSQMLNFVYSLTFLSSLPPYPSPSLLIERLYAESKEETACHAHFLSVSCYVKVLSPTEDTFIHRKDLLPFTCRPCAIQLKNLLYFKLRNDPVTLH